MFSRLMIDQGNPHKHNVAVQDDPEVYHEIKTLNTDNETIRERIEEETSTSTFQDYHILP